MVTADRGWQAIQPTASWHRCVRQFTCTVGEIYSCEKKHSGVCDHPCPHTCKSLGHILTQIQSVFQFYNMGYYCRTGLQASCQPSPYCPVNTRVPSPPEPTNFPPSSSFLYHCFSHGKILYIINTLVMFVKTFYTFVSYNTHTYSHV